MEQIQLFIIDIIKTYSISVFWILVLFFGARVVLKKIVRKMIKLVEDENYEDKSDSEKRAETLGGIIITTGNVVIYIVVLLMVLKLFGVDITPILAGVGIIGLAVGFGAQSLVKDFVSGLFILIENQYGIGDKVKIGSFEGRVKKITMRATVLQDDEGKTFHISNGLIKDVVNFSQSKK
ncbi:mechanosensitive ion channel [Candidatus Parcubacteria bacterium]|nr:mechanosensitive ion channel [Candidatus Parcubacteria bacterium]